MKERTVRHHDEKPPFVKDGAEDAERVRRQLAQILDSISDAFFALDDNLVVAYFNKAAEKLLGRKAEDVVGHNLFEAFPEAKGSIFEEMYTKAVREKIPLTFETYFSVKPYENWYEVRVYPQENGISVYFQVTTERKKAEEELRESEERFRKVFDEGPLGMAIVGLDYNMLQVNRRLCDILGHTEEELTGLKFTEITYPEDVNIDLDLSERLFRGEIPFFEIDKRYVKKNKEIVWGHLTASVVRDGEGRPLYGLAMLQDITDAKRLEEVRKDELDFIAHDLGSPLTAIAVYGEVLERRLADKGMKQEAGELQMIRGAVRQANLMIDDLVELTSLQLGALGRRPEPADVWELVNQAVRQEDTGGRVKVEAPDFVPPVYARADRVERAVSNLIRNALKFSPQDAPVQVRVAKAGSDVLISVTDHGPGIAPKDLPHVFEKGYRAEPTAGHEGMGLGLHIAGLIVESNGGRIRADSKPGEGSTFYISLPLARVNQ